MSHHKSTHHKNQKFRDFYDQVGEKYPEEDLVYKTLRGIVRKRFVLEKLSVLAGDFLDLGCNRGMYTGLNIFNKNFGVDLSFPVLKSARKKNNAFYVQGDAQDLNFIKAGSLDVILCSEVIEHLLDPEAVISRCYESLRIGGHLLVTTPNFKNKRPTWIGVGEMSDFGISGMEGQEYYHTAYKPQELKKMAEQAGFSNIEVGTFEKEVKYATRLPVLVYHSVDKLNTLFFRSQRVSKFNGKILNATSLLIYKLCVRLSLNDFFCGMINEGVRTFLFAKK